MRVHDMHHWKPDDVGAAVIGMITGCSALLAGIPFLSGVSTMLQLIWSLFVAGCMGAAGWAGKKVVEENWDRIKKMISKPFKRKPRA